ncbi:hypothetical protein GQR93_13680 [Lentilactobacillus hilgardii]|jgi:hypothetical protein|uniref:Uncharacterized protein n=2 Tax=Lentilactobacillus hilgardii TaxID=1588 RepID=A0A6P1EGP6_LENHI|nr:SH3 domain-containing protein [Lentilactobacillus hilgardii]QHB53164.1 hypothetical protein GQR93_13680 [Lentilactobacillus hilgardii]
MDTTAAQNTPDGYTLSESGQFQFNTNCKVRSTPDMSATGESTVKAGSYLNFDGREKNGNHFWFYYTDATGVTHYVPYANIDDGQYFGSFTNGSSDDPIQSSSTGGNTGSGDGGSVTGTGLGTLTGQDGANVANQTPDGTSLAIDGSFTFDIPMAAHKDSTAESSVVGPIDAGTTLNYNGKVKDDNYYWLRYEDVSTGNTLYAPYASIDPFQYYGTDSNPGDPVYSSVQTGTGSGSTDPSQSTLDFVADLGGISGTNDSNSATNDAAFQKLYELTQGDSNTRTVNIPAGAFMINRPNIGSNLVFNGNNGTIFLGTTSNNEDSDHHQGAAFMYNQVSNVSWSNVSFRGINFTDPTTNKENVYRIVHNIFRSSQISFNQCIFDQNESNGGHSLDLGGSTNISVNNSTFIGVGGNASDLSGSEFYKEAIQTDYAYQGGVSAYDSSQNYTLEPTHDVTIDSCKFLPLYTDSSVSTLAKYAPQPVGTHVTQDYSDVINNIKLTNSTIIDVKPANYGGYGFYAPIHFPNSRDITITGNIIERRKTKVSPNVFMFYSYKEGSQPVANTNFNVNSNQIYNMNPQLVHVDASAADNKLEPLKYAPAYALFTVAGGHTMDDIHFESNSIYTYASMQTPKNQDDHSFSEKQNDIDDSDNYRVKGVGATTYDDTGTTRYVKTDDGGSGNEAAHTATTQNVIAVLPDGTQTTLGTVNVQQDLPYSYSLSSYNSYSPAFSDVPVGQTTLDGNVYVPYV